MMIVDAPYPQPTSATFAPARSFASAPSRAGIHDWTRFAPYPGRKAVQQRSDLPGPSPGPESPGRITGSGPGCWFVQFLQPEMLPSGSQLSGVFLAIREMVRVTGLPVLA
jgi:hypothetical protein